MRFINPLAACVLLSALSAVQAADDARVLVKLPAPMRAHMLANMRDHLTVLSEIQAALAKGEFDKAAELAENRLGMSSLASHNAAHMAPHMPKSMQDTGTAMHRAASRFARAAQEAAVKNDLRPALADLAQVTQQCVACHAGYRIQ